MKLELINITKHFGADTLFSNVSGYVGDHEIIGLVGNNGVGKSTFCNIITGNDTEYDGNVHIFAGTQVAYFKQMLEDIGEADMTVFDYVLHTQQHLLDLETEYNTVLNRLQTEEVTPALLNDFGMLQERFYNEGAHDLIERIEQVLHGLGIYETAEISAKEGKRNITWTTQLKYLSGGERKIVELATVLLNRTANVLILDEPTNHLDMEARAWFQKFMQEFNGSIILVSHDRHLLNAVTDQIWEIADKTLATYKGNYDRFEELKNERFEAALHLYETQQKEVKRQEEIVKQLYDWGKMPAYQSKKLLLEKYKETIIQVKPQQRPDIRLSLADFPPRGYAVLRLDHFSFSFSPEKPIFLDETVTFTKDDKVALLGANGIGKSTLMKLILTKYSYLHRIDPAKYGIEDFYEKYLDTVKDDKKFYIGPSIKVAYYSQHHNQLPSDMTIRELLRQNEIKDESQFQSVIRRFHFSKDTVDDKKIGNLSGGEKSKLQFMLLAISDASVLLLDEPINHLDIASMKVVEDVLHEFKGSLFVISHDRYFLSKVVNKIVYIKDKHINEFLGTIDEYLNTIK